MTALDDDKPTPRGELVIQVIPLPSDTNPNGAGAGGGAGDTDPTRDSTARPDARFDCKSLCLVRRK